MDTLSYFASQSPITDPGKYGDVIAAMPKDAAALCAAIQGLCLNYKVWYTYKVGTEQMLQSNDHYVSDIIKNILNKCKAPLTEARAEDHERLYTSTADCVSLFCSVARANGIPTRKRVGYKVGDTYIGYDIAEYWNGTAWEQADAAGRLDGCKFVSAAEAWQAWKKGELDADLVHCDPSCGVEALRAGVMLDLAAVNKMEMLNWDRYGWMLTPVKYQSKRAAAVLNEVAELLLDVDANIEALQAVYTREEGLEVPDVVKCEHPLIPEFKFTLR